MNLIIIILGIVIAILIYVLYNYFTVKSNTIQSAASLKTPLTAITNFEAPSNTRYAYGIWVYVNSWDTNVDKVIFSRANNLKLYLDKNSPTLKLDVLMTDGSIYAPAMQITDNFPLQKWCHIIISVDNQFVDAYLDGKLIKSQRFLKNTNNMTIIPKQPGDLTSPIYLGNSGSASPSPFDTYIAKFKRWTGPIDPQTAWNSYMEGNGNSGLFKVGSSYGVDVALLKDNIIQKKFSLM
jgi:hypothetical protein